MAFDAQITDLVGGTIDQTACDQWMEDGVRELVNLFPKNLKEMCYSKNTFTSAAAGSEAETIASQHLGNVFAGSYICRRISGANKYKASDSDEMLYATATDPAYYIEGGILNILPASSSGVYYLIPDPSIDVDADSAITSFPNEAEYLVVLYAAIKQLLQYQSTMSSSFNSDIGTAFTATNTELDETQAICDLINTQADSAVTALGNMGTEIGLANTEVDLANPEIDLAKAEILETVTLIDSSIDTAVGLITTAVGKVNAQIVLASTEFDLVNPEVDLEDMEKAAGYAQAGQNYLQEAQVQLGEASGHVNEVSARIAQVNGQIAVANGYLATASGYNQTGQAYLGVASTYGNQAGGFLNAAQGFSNELQSKISIANGYITEASARLQADSAKYQWYGDQHAKLSADYARGLAVLKGGE